MSLTLLVASDSRLAADFGLLSSHAQPLVAYVHGLATAEIAWR
jgi:hypothetical protein